MRINCKQCGYVNLPDSKFCQRCGFKLPQLGKSSVETAQPKIYDQIEELDDVIFRPKKRSSNLAMWILIAIILFFALVVFVVYIATLSEETDVGTNVETTHKETTPVQFPVNYLTLDNLDSEWVGTTLYIKGTIKNDYTEVARNLDLRIDFAWDSENKSVFDTRYIKLEGVSAKGAYSFNEPVFINQPEDKFWYTVTLVGADY
jgi:hypothetical protein